MANSRVVNGPMQVIAANGALHRNLTVNSTATNFIVASLTADATHVYWSLEGCDARMSIDGVAPTTVDGHIIKDGNSGIWSRSWALSAKVISVSGSGKFTISELNHF